MAACRFHRPLLALALATASFAASGADNQIPIGPGSNLVYSKCQACHSLQYVHDAKGLLPAQWDAVVASMLDYGLEISDADKSTVIKYLTTYLGPHPPPAPAATAPAAKLDGKEVWAQNCASCHGAQGAGQPGYFPPLAGNPDLFQEQVFPVLVVLNGITGPLTVKGQPYNGTMPPFGGHLSDDEIAAVVNFVRGAWGNEAQAGVLAPVTPALVAQQRARPLTPAEVHARRK